MRRLVLLLIALCAACNPPTNGSKAVATADPVDVETLLFGDEGFQQKLRGAIVARGGEYQPRTKHKRADGTPRYVNRLILEASPYLVQHAHNPVNWFPWGDEAFALAKQLNRPVFLSVGYATCHWCHVMEEESFEDEEVAKLINAHYIPVKVDREERPDVDAIYMRAVMLLTSRGGWPMSVWLTPQRKPFYAGTYFPARDGDRGVKKGFLSLLREQADAYARDPSGISNDAEQLAAQVQRDLAPPKSTELPTGKTIDGARETAERRYDPVHGGPKGRPKFPASFPIRFLLRHGLRADDARSTAMALDSLRKMQAGGIYDQVGGGFHRYTVDEVWLVPHFEKMLYDNARLSIAYLEALQISRAGKRVGDADFERVARETLDYVEREMTAPAGGYYSATDADSLGPDGERQEGYYFTWTPSEIDAALGEANGKLVRAYYGVTAAGNFEHGRSILHTPKSRAEVAAELGISAAALSEAIAEAIPKLRAARNQRPRPILDDKILVGHNGLMIAAMARGARVLGERRYVEGAQKAARFLLDKLMVDGRLMHSFHAHGGRSTVSAFAEDYAFFAGGLIDLFEASHDPRWLAAAVAMMDQLEAHHGHTAGGYFRTADDAERLLAREIEQRDGAIPSASAWALMNQLRLWTLTTDDRWRQRAESTLRAFAAQLADQPWTLDEMMLAVDYYTDSPKEVVLVLPEGTPREAPDAQAMLDVMRDRYVPNHVFVLASRPPSDALAKLVPWASDKPAKDGKPTAYVCERGACDLPTTEPSVFAQQVTKVVPYPAPAGEEE